MPRALQVCSVRGCSKLKTEQHRHPELERISTRNHRGVGFHRRYGPEFHEAKARFRGRACELRLPGCTGLSQTADHGPEGLRPACHHCNYADGARRATEARMEKR